MRPSTLSLGFALLLVLSLGVKVQARLGSSSPAIASDGEDIIATLGRSGFATSRAAPNTDPTWVYGVKGECKLQIADISLQGWHRSALELEAVGAVHPVFGRREATHGAADLVAYDDPLFSSAGTIRRDRCAAAQGQSNRHRPRLPRGSYPTARARGTLLDGEAGLCRMPSEGRVGRTGNSPQRTFVDSDGNDDVAPTTEAPPARLTSGTSHRLNHGR